MLISKHAVVSIHYTLKDDRGTVLDSSEGAKPLTYIQGIGAIIPGLEESLEGRQAGESIDVSIPPDRGYGERHQELVLNFPKSNFNKPNDLEVGMMFRGQFGEEERIVTVTNIDGDDVTVDANHPLAGLILNFSVDVVGVRDATQEEIDHGHVHNTG